MNGEDLARDLALLAARLTVGGSIAAHGAQKMFGAFDGPGPEKAGGFFKMLGFEEGERYARAASAAEMTSGALIALGAFGPAGPAMLLSVMAVAVETVHRPKGYFNDKGGFELNTMYAVIALLLATNGPGALSFDALLGLNKRFNAVHGWLALFGGLMGAAMILSKRTPQPPAHEQSVSSAGEVAQEERVGA
ncbi:MAG TPA: DoxX family protein [Candidatus Baltobacteraceae bacterium]|jgi:putative oxidoreductase|nr:DoxX family protein [Candidatus Baltobacteraceae bacterium]